MPVDDVPRRSSVRLLKLRRLAGVLVKVLAGLGLLVASAWGLNLAGLSVAFGRAKPAYVALAAGVVLLTLLAKAARWRTLCGDAAARSPFVAGIVIGQLLNLLPGRAGDLARVAVLGREPAVGYTLALGSLVAEKLLDSCMLLVLISGLLPLVSVQAGASAASSAAAVGLMAAVLLSVLLMVRSGRVRAWLGSAARRWLGRRVGGLIAAGLTRFDAARWTDWRAWASTLFIWLLAALTNQLMFWALDLRLPWSAAPALLVALHLGRLVGVTPGQVGVFHYLCILVLDAYGVTQEAAFACGVILHLVVIGPAAVWGLWALRRLEVYGADWLETGRRWIRQLKGEAIDGRG
jgi:uncharacterized membrane protein YbhN (UPF0104 family)